MPLAPLSQGDDNGEEISPRRGKRVELPPARGGSLAPEDSAFDESTQPVGEDVAGDTGPVLEVGESPGAVHRVPNDEQAPTVPDQIERPR